MDEIQVLSPDTIQYTDYEYFAPDDATNWVYDLVKYCIDIKHKTFVKFSEYVAIIRLYKQYLESNHIKLLSNHDLLNEQDLKFYEFIEKIWGVPADLTDNNGDTAYNLPQILISHKPEKFSNPFFELLKNKQNVTIELPGFTLAKLIDFDIQEIKKIYNGDYIFPADNQPKFYLVTDSIGYLDYVHKFINDKVLNAPEHTLIWDVYTKGNDCVALVYLHVDKDNKTADLDVILAHDYSDTNFAQVIKFIKDICFKKLQLETINAVNLNKDFVYSTLNTIYHFAGFKATYDVDHSTFVAQPDAIPSIDELYTTQENIVDNIVVDI